MARLFYEERGIQIWHGDCREVLPMLPSSSVNIVLTSPPYNVGLNYDGFNDTQDEQAFLEFNRCWLREAFRVAAESARLYAVVSDKMLWWFRAEAEAIGWTYGNLIAWCKPNLASGGNRIGGDWNQMVEYILLFRKGKRTPMLQGADVMSNTHNWMVIPSPQSNWNDEQKLHPAQWPLELPRRIIARTPGALILDPFCGSGSGLIAAKQLGRKAIGIEKVERVCALAAERLRQSVFDFSEPEPVIEQVKLF